LIPLLAVAAANLLLSDVHLSADDEAHHYFAVQSPTLGASVPSPVPEPGSVHSVLPVGLTAAAGCAVVVSSLYFRQPSVVEYQQRY